MRNLCPFTEEQHRLFEAYQKEPISLKRAERRFARHQFPEYQSWMEYEARRPETGECLPRQDYDEARYPGESRESNKKSWKFVRPLDDAYWYFYPQDARLLRRLDKGMSAKGAVRAAIVTHFLAWNVYRKVHDCLRCHPWEKGHVWLSRAELAAHLGMEAAEVREATARACEAGLLRQSKEHRSGGKHPLFYRMVETERYFRTRKGDGEKQWRMRVDIAQEHGFAAASLYENQVQWTRRALEGSDEIRPCGQKMADLAKAVYLGIFSRSELEKGFDRLVKGGLLVRQVEAEAKAGTRNIRYYSLPDEEIARLRAEVRAEQPQWGAQATDAQALEIEAEVARESLDETPGVAPAEAILVESTPRPAPQPRPVELGLTPFGAQDGQISLSKLDELPDDKWVKSNPPVRVADIPKVAPKSQMTAPKSQILVHKDWIPWDREGLASLGPPYPARNTAQRARPADASWSALQGLPPEGPGRGALKRINLTPGGSRANRKHELPRRRSSFSGRLRGASLPALLATGQENSTASST